MFWKRRNVISLILILLSAILIPQGLALFVGSDGGLQETQPANTSYAATMPTHGAPAETNAGHRDPVSTPTISPDAEHPSGALRRSRFGGAVLTLLGFAAGFVGIFVLFSRKPFLGPDLASVLLALCLVFLGYYELPALPLGLLLLSARELWGWLLNRLSLDWCLCHRLGKRTRLYPLILSILAFALLGLLGVWFPDTYPELYPVAAGLALPLLLCLACLVRWYRDLSHLQKQLSNLAEGLPTVPKEGTFKEAEDSLSRLQETQREAIQTAVTSERFKVELISNVSHDLRTPLTAILGYSELLQSEDLSPEAREKVVLLHRKAEYMDALVESLFELTKVSSGVLEPKLANLDLIRLLEQTIGLFDDKLTAVNLQVRRHYEAEILTLVTDGARLHQVFANLMGNAIKYALPGTRIHLEVTETESLVRVRMVNIASYEMDFQPEEILQRFARGDKARSTKGSGLGLAIAQTYTESLGGSFRIAIDGDQFSAIVELPKN